MPLEQRSRQVTLVSNVLPRGSPESEKLALCCKTSPRGPKRNTAVLSNRLDNVKWTMNLKHIFFTCAGSFSVFFLPIPSGLLYFKEYHQLERVDFTKKNSCPGGRSNKEDQGGPRRRVCRIYTEEHVQPSLDFTLVYILCSCYFQVLDDALFV